MRKFVGKPEVPKEHITNHRLIVRVLENNFKLKRCFDFFSVGKIYVFEWTH